MKNTDKEKRQLIELIAKFYSTVNLSRKQAAEILNISTATLDRMRENGIGPSYSKADTGSLSKNGRVSYPVTAIADYLVNNQVKCA